MCVMTTSAAPSRAPAPPRRGAQPPAHPGRRARGLRRARAGVTLDEIARHAGVGVGTVYRRFPDKEQLIDALFEERIEEIAAVARAATELDDPWEGLVGFFMRAQELQARTAA